MKKARVIFSSNGNYKVQLLDDTKKVYWAKALGIFRKEKKTLFVGDIISLRLGTKGETNVITDIDERFNLFMRPKISNIDYALIVTSINEPNLSDYLLDKMISIFQMSQVKPILIFTKADLGISKINKETINEYIAADYLVFILKNKITPEQKSQLYNLLKDKLTVITGQTGVGKSTFLNHWNPKFNILTQEISKRLNRGKHTTRHVTIYEVEKGVLLVDTPGFSSLTLTSEQKLNLPQYFFSFEKNVGKCKFNDCNHINVKDCSVNVSARSMNNYIKLINEDILK